MSKKADRKRLAGKLKALEEENFKLRVASQKLLKLAEAKAQAWQDCSEELEKRVKLARGTLTQLEERIELSAADGFSFGTLKDFVEEFNTALGGPE